MQRQQEALSRFTDAHPDCVLLLGIRAEGRTPAYGASRRLFEVHTLTVCQWRTWNQQGGACACSGSRVAPQSSRHAP